MNRLGGYIWAGMFLVLSSLPARAESMNDPGQPQSDYKVRCFEETKNEDGVTESYTAQWCEE